MTGDVAAHCQRTVVGHLKLKQFQPLAELAFANFFTNTEQFIAPPRLPRLVRTSPLYPFHSAPNILQAQGIEPYPDTFGNVFRFAAHPEFLASSG